MLVNLFSVENLIQTCISIPVILFSLSFHEASHAFAANKLGDPTAKNLGRLTLNPLKHLDPIGTLCMILFHFGYAKPVPINARYFKNPKKGMALSALAGPVSNILLGALGLLLYNVFMALVLRTGVWYDKQNLCSLIALVFYYLYVMNIYLAIFNMLPIPPFDGSRLAFVFLPDKLYWGVMKYERIIMLVTLVLLATGLLSIPLDFLSGKVMWLLELPYKFIPFFQYI